MQGDQAKYEICKAIATANALKHCDVLLLARGGGSLEDLWAFNEEMVARSIFASTIPIISGIGHETDVTIADFVADLRAATPTAAAEHASPDVEQWLDKFNSLGNRLQHHLQRILQQQQQKVDWLSGRLQQQHPKQRLGGNRQRLAELELRLINAIQQGLANEGRNISTKEARLWQCSPISRIQSHRQQQIYLYERLMAATQANLQRCNQRFHVASQTLQTVSPLATLNRGYALVTDAVSGQIIRSTKQLKIGNKLNTQLASGQFISRVEQLLDD